MSVAELRAFYERPIETVIQAGNYDGMHQELLSLLERGELRAAEELPSGEWFVNAWVKQAILVGFKAAGLDEYDFGGFSFVDRTAFPPRRFSSDHGIRIVPGGTTVRRGAHVAPGAVIMPPAFVNVGAFVGAGSMVDSHALVGSCAQVGARVHLSAGAQIGGVLEPAGARPVIVEDEAFVGALAGVFEGVRVRRRAVLAAGVVLTGSSTIFDLVHGREWQKEVPEGAVVVPGTRPASGDYAKQRGLAVAAPMIVKYRDAKTDAATALEAALR